MKNEKNAKTPAHIPRKEFNRANYDKIWKKQLRPPLTDIELFGDEDELNCKFINHTITKEQLLKAIDYGIALPPLYTFNMRNIDSEVISKAIYRGLELQFLYMYNADKFSKENIREAITRGVELYPLYCSIKHLQYNEIDLAIRRGIKLEILYEFHHKSFSENNIINAINKGKYLDWIYQDFFKHTPKTLSLAILRGENLYYIIAGLSHRLNNNHFMSLIQIGKYLDILYQKESHRFSPQVRKMAMQKGIHINLLQEYSVKKEK